MKILGISAFYHDSAAVLTLDGRVVATAMFYDVTGRMVKQVDMKGTFRRAIDISSMDNGMYIIQIKSEDGAFSSIKFIKK